MGFHLDDLSVILVKKRVLWTIEHNAARNKRRIGKKNA